MNSKQRRWILVEWGLVALLMGCSDSSSHEASPTPSAVPTPTSSALPTEASTTVPTLSATPIPTATSTREASPTPSTVPTPTISIVPTEANTPAPTPTATPVPNATSTPSGDDLLAELMANRAVWEEVGAVRYRMLQRVRCFCFSGYPHFVAIEVLDGQIVSARDVWTGTEVQDPPDNLYRTVDEIFDLIAEAIENGADRISVEYSQFVGAPIETYIDYSVRFDDEIRYVVSDMTIFSE